MGLHFRLSSFQVSCQRHNLQFLFIPFYLYLLVFALLSPAEFHVSFYYICVFATLYIYESYIHTKEAPFRPRFSSQFTPQFSPTIFDLHCSPYILPTFYIEIYLRFAPISKPRNCPRLDHLEIASRGYKNAHSTSSLRILILSFALPLHLLPSCTLRRLLTENRPSHLRLSVLRTILLCIILHIYFVVYTR
jgi:hypothetical protein